MGHKTLQEKILRRGKCPEWWGSHGCKKQNGHKNNCQCWCGSVKPEK